LAGGAAARTSPIQSHFVRHALNSAHLLKSEASHILVSEQTKQNQTNDMNIGIIGAGNVGGALGTSWAQAGHQVNLVQKMGTGFTWAMLERVQASARG
jgi:phosphoglycerate dehydrogenase-like enzyme